MYSTIIWKKFCIYHPNYFRIYDEHCIVDHNNFQMICSNRSCFGWDLAKPDISEILISLHGMILSVKHLSIGVQVTLYVWCFFNSDRV